ncbi:MAG: copper resistance protein B [Celeribacter sp.]|jgi:copper resistance protein B
MSSKPNKDMQTMKTLAIIGVATASALLAAPAAALAEPAVWSLRTEKLEYRSAEGEGALAWDVTAMAGTDELRFVYTSEGQRSDSGSFDEMENQLRLQKPVSEFFDAFVGVAASTPEDEDARHYGVLGVTGLAPQWFEVEATLFVADHPYLSAEADYEALLTNRLILTPWMELSIPLSDDDARHVAAGGVSAEMGLRLSYDLIGRSVSPYVGVSYERSYGGTADLLRAAGDDVSELSSVIGVNLNF